MPLPTIRPDVSQSPPLAGVSHLSFDSEGTLLLVRLDTQPNIVHIHTFLPTPTSPSAEINHLAILVFARPVRSARWCAGKRKVAISTKGGGIYFWDGDGGWIDDGTGPADPSAEMRGGMMEGVGIPTRQLSSPVRYTHS